jgi:hypothetical protein
MSRKPATRRQSSPPPTDPPPSAEGDAAATAPPSVPTAPVQRIRIKRPPLQRAGGHVLTERGWVPAASHDEEK